MTTANDRPNLTMLKGGKLSPSQFAQLSLQGKIDYLHHQRGSGKIRTILESPQPASLVRSLPRTDLFQLLHELGKEESLEILHLASPEQVRFILDWELWEEWSVSVDKTAEWLDLLLTDEDQAMETVSALDQELLLVFLKKTIDVGGGLGDIVNSEDHQQEWDHTFDEMYYIRFLDKERSDLVLRLLDLLFRQDQPLYRSLMQGVENELLSELEEQAGQFRRGRLADDGFPELHEAATLYARIAPEEFVPRGDKIELPVRDELPPFPLVGTEETSLLSRAFSLADSPALRREFHYLTNGAMVADGVSPADQDGMEAVLGRVGNYLTIALEFLGGGEGEGARLLREEHLRRLFSLGHSLLAQLQERARRLASDNYAAGKALQGLTMKRPKFYRGLDSDTVDEYREFTGMDDVRRMDQFLRGLESA
jgi:hypothetical protein